IVESTIRHLIRGRGRPRDAGSGIWNLAFGIQDPEYLDGRAVMRRVPFAALRDRQGRFGGPGFWLLAGLLAALGGPGCHHEEENHYQSVTRPLTVQLVQPQVRDLVRVVGQPSFVEAYERSSVYPKMNAYIQKWIVDIGDTVKKDQPLAYLFVPELVEDHGTKKAMVVLDRGRGDLALKGVKVAEADVEGAEGGLGEAG